MINSNKTKICFSPAQDDEYDGVADDDDDQRDSEHSEGGIDVVPNRRVGNAFTAENYVSCHL